MNHCYRHFNGSFFVPLSRLSERLEAISVGAHQWAARQVEHFFLNEYGSYSALVLLGYSNPDPSRMLNIICFAVPLIELAGDRERTPQWVVCLSSNDLIPVSTSVYWDNNQFRPDPEWDFDVFWNVLTEECGVSKSDLTPYFFDEVKSEAQPLTLFDGRTYADALADHLERLALESRPVQKALNKRFSSPRSKD